MEMESITNIVKRLLKNTGLETENEINFIHDNWEKIAGPAVGKGTEPYRLDGRKLVVHADNSVIMAEAGYRKKEILKKINAIFKEEKVREIIFRIKQ